MLAGLATRTLFEDRFPIALPAEHRLARRRQLREADLADEELLLLTEGHCLREQALAACGARGVDEAADFRASSLSTLIEIVSGGEGVTLLPELSIAVEARRRDLALVRFAPPIPLRTIGLAWRAASGRAPEYALLAEWLVPTARSTAKSRGRVAKPRA